jgi:hypothetical protein
MELKICLILGIIPVGASYSFYLSFVAVAAALAAATTNAADWR